MHQILNVPRPVKVMSGRAFVRRLRNATPQRRAKLAADFMAGFIALKNPTTKQAAGLCGARPFHVLQERRAMGHVRPIACDRTAQIKRIERLLAKIVELDGVELMLARVDAETASPVL